MDPTAPTKLQPPKAPEGQSLQNQLTEIDASAGELNAEPPSVAPPKSPAPKRGPGRPKGAKTGSGTRRRPSGAGTASGAAKVTEVAANLGRAGGASTATTAALGKLEKRWTTFLTEILGYGSVLWVWWLTHDDEGFGEDEKDELEMDDEEAASIGEPLGRILLKYQFLREHSEQILQSSDYIAVAAGLGAYAASTGPQLRAKRRRNAERQAIRRNQAGLQRQQTHQHRGAQNVPRDQNGSAPPEPERDGPIEARFTPVQPFTPGAQLGGDN